MLERIDYVLKNQSVWIYRCYGEGTIVELPGVIRGLPVVNLADHCFAQEPSYRYKPHEIYTIYREEWEGDGAGETEHRLQGTAAAPEYPVFTSQIEEVYFPENLVAIEDYVFYGCPNLHIIHIPTTMRRFGGQSFVATHHINCFYFTVDNESETPYMLKEVLKELPDRLDIIFENRAGQKVFQILYLDYYEESRENTPARLFDLVFHGTGYMYRQCFNGREIDFKKFDEQFHFAVAQEYMPYVFQLAYTRLTYPRGFSEEAKEEHLAWLRLEYKALSRWIFDEHKEDLIRTLGDYGYYTEDILSWFMNVASDRKSAENVSYLMDYRRTHFGAKKKKKYEF
ncbi:MAG: leucine-rich repeat protein [Clostridiales bacterium]|nr:leucine-rich repeat protein [Candidatus Blautia equi]